jgi:SWI/SNF-related matrix-associated actin-dependent regulator 1 of chromatin subfamily A
MILSYEDDKVIAVFNYSEKYTKVLRKMQGSFFDGAKKRWVAPKSCTRELCREMRKNAFYLSLSDEIQKEFKVNKEGFSEKEIAERERWRLNHISNATDCLDFDEESLELKYPLLKYQRGGIYYAEQKNGRLLLADDMGLGKTIQAIGIAKKYKRDWPVVVVAPASLLLNWRKEFLTWLPKDINEDDVTVMRDGKMSPRGKIIICSYHYAHTRLEDLITFLGIRGVLLVDEAQAIKNFNAKRTGAVVSLSHVAKRVVLMTGTPILNRVEELYSLVHAIDPIGWGDYYSFVFRYCAAEKTKFGLFVGGVSNDEELHRRLREELMCRRLKTDVLKQLPEKRRVTLTLDTNKKIVGQTQEILEYYIHRVIYAIHTNDYNLQKAKSYILAENGADVSESLFEAYRLTGMAKADSLCEWIEEKISSGLNKLIIFGHHKDFLNSVQEKIEAINEKRVKANKKIKIKEEKVKPLGFMRIDGTTTKEKRFLNQERFQQEEECNIALLSINAANSGLTLTSSNVVIMGELPWTPGVSRQAEDRVHRIGQELDVMIYYTIADDTFDGALWNMLRNKSLVASKVLDDGHGDEMDESIEMGSGDLLSALIVDTYQKMKDGKYEL